jgi:hypothetical protein
MIALKLLSEERGETQQTIPSPLAPLRGIRTRQVLSLLAPLRGEGSGGEGLTERDSPTSPLIPSPSPPQGRREPHLSHTAI